MKISDFLKKAAVAVAAYEAANTVLPEATSEATEVVGEGLEIADGGRRYADRWTHNQIRRSIFWFVGLLFIGLVPFGLATYFGRTDLTAQAAVFFIVMVIIAAAGFVSMLRRPVTAAAAVGVAAAIDRSATGGQVFAGIKMNSRRMMSILGFVLFVFIVWGFINHWAPEASDRAYLFWTVAGLLIALCFMDSKRKQRKYAWALVFFIWIVVLYGGEAEFKNKIRGNTGSGTQPEVTTLFCSNSNVVCAPCSDEAKELSESRPTVDLKARPTCFTAVKWRASLGSVRMNNNCNSFDQGFVEGWKTPDGKLQTVAIPPGKSMPLEGVGRIGNYYVIYISGTGPVRVEKGGAPDVPCPGDLN